MYAGVKNQRLQYFRKYYPEYTKNLRLKVLDVLGEGKCAKCGIDDYRCLQIDHVKGNGRNDKNNPKGKAGLSFHLWIVNNIDEAKKYLQILCANCNWIKKYENKELGGRKRNNDSL